MILAKGTWVRAALCVCAIAQCWSPFLPEGHSAGLGKAAPFALSASGTSSNAPALRQVAPGIYMYKDTCNVYAIVKGFARDLGRLWFGRDLKRAAISGSSKGRLDFAHSFPSRSGTGRSTRESPWNQNRRSSRREEILRSSRDFLERKRPC